jgi:hypothetical protein
MHSIPEKDTRTDQLAVSEVDTREVGAVRATPDALPAFNRETTLNLWNWLIANGRCTFLVYIPGAGGYEVVKFEAMTDRFFISAVYKDKIAEKMYHTILSHYTTFGICLNSESWFL